MANNYQTIASNFRKDPINNTVVSKPIIQPDVISPNSSGIVPMWEIPEVRNRVKVMNVDGTYKVECFNAKEVTEEKYFYVDYALGDCYFHKNELGKAITMIYRGIGNSSLYAGRVYTKLGEEGDVSETIQDIVTKGRASIDFYNATGSAIQLQDDLEATNIEALATNAILQQAIVDGGLQTMKDDISNVEVSLGTKASQSSVDNIKLTTSPHLLKYKTVSVTVRSITDKPSLSDWQHLKLQGVSATMVVMVGLTSATSYAPTMMDDSIINGVIADANTVGVKIDMIKLHLGTNYSDGFNRGDYLPSDVNAYFTNWQVICLHYSQMCNTNNIPILCIGCEQPNQSKDVYLPKWTTIVNAIKTTYPNLLLTYAGKTWEFPNNGCNAICSILDIIGYNVYLSYTQKKLSEATPTVEQMGKAFYINYDGNKVIDTIIYLSKKYNKKVMITEIGCMPLDTGLITNVPYGYATETRNYDAIAWLMRASFEVLFRNQHVIGFGWWHIKEPFDYYNNTEITSAEQAMIDYVKGGLI